MKLLITLFVLAATVRLAAQTVITPGYNVVENKWITNRNYQMTWYAIKDTAKIEMGKIVTHISVANGKILVATDVRLQQSQSPWIDSTIARANDLSPVYHSSYNIQRHMALQFGPVVKGFYYDKIKDFNTAVSDTPRQGYFDSNLYPLLITWLPLQEGYTADIAIYDYKPGSRTGVMKATVQDVRKSVHSTMQSGVREVWVVRVTDEIAGAGNGSTTYYIDTADRRLWKLEIVAGSRRMELLLMEK